MPDKSSHETCVDQWLDRTRAKSLPREAMVDLFEAAVAAIWARTSVTLGAVTLAAITDRVLHTATEKYPPFAAVVVARDGRINAQGFRTDSEALHYLRLMEGIRFVLVEFLTVLGTLSAELLTPVLHAELAAVVPDRRAGSTPRKQAKDAAPVHKERS